MKVRLPLQPYFFLAVLLQQLNKLVNWILFTSFYAACCATGMCMATERLVLAHIPPLFTPLHMLVFGSTLFVYNTHYLIKRSAPDVSDRFQWSQHYKLWHYIALSAGMVACVASLFWMPVNVFYACIVLGVLSFGYSLPLLPFKNKKRLKDFGWFKILLLTSVWTIVTSVLPMLYWGKSLADYPFEICLRFGLLLTLCIAFDMRDMQTDLDAKIFTLPNLIGVKNSYSLMSFTMLLFIALSVVQYLRYPSVTRLTGELVTALATKLAIDYARKYPSDKAYLALVDGVMLLYAVLVLWH